MLLGPAFENLLNKKVWSKATYTKFIHTPSLLMIVVQK